MTGEDRAGLQARRAALRLIETVVRDGGTLRDTQEDIPAPDRARALTLSGTVLRHLRSIDHLINQYAAQPPKGMVQRALRLATAELLVLDTPAHAAVDAAVRLATEGSASRKQAGFVNAVARRIARDGPADWSALDHGALALPAHIFDRLKKAYNVKTAHRIAEACLTVPALDLTLRDPTQAAEWAETLKADVLETGGLRCASHGQISRLPGYADGAWWVQDAAASLPARVLAVKPGERVLDLCSAPGGKAMQLVSRGADVTALDISDARLRMLRENLKRTGLSASIISADALSWVPDKPFDAILLDAPCSATGTIRRHPDLARRRNGFDLGALTVLQDALLERAFNWLRPGGRLVFATCSLFPQEGERRIARFLENHPEAALSVIAPSDIGGDPDWGVDGMIRTQPFHWPERGGLDGFFIARIERNATANIP